MDVLGQFLDERAASAGDGDEHAARLVAFDSWVRRKLAEKLDWTWAGAQRERRIEQCRLELERLVLELWRRGWMLDGKALAARIVALLDAVGGAQRKREIGDFWPYFSASCRRYVGANAEEIREQSLRMGSHVGAAMAAILGGRGGAAAGPSLTELVAQRAGEVAEHKASLRERISKHRQGVCKADAPTLPGL